MICSSSIGKISNAFECVHLILSFLNNLTFTATKRAEELSYTEECMIKLTLGFVKKPTHDQAFFT